MGVFSEKVKRDKKVTNPRKQSFSLAAWEKLAEKYSLSDTADIMLHDSGKHIHSKLAAIRRATAQSSLSQVATETRIRALIAGANHQFEAVMLRVNGRASEIASAKTEGEGLNLSDLANVQVKLAGGENWNLDSVLNSLPDGLLFPIRAALRGPQVSGLGSFADIDWRDIAYETNLGVFYDQAEQLWEDCVWNSYFLVEKSPQRIQAVPSKADAKRGFHISRLRKIALSFETIHYAQKTLAYATELGLSSQLPDVQGVISEGGQQLIVLGSGELNEQGQMMMLAFKSLSSPSYFDSLADEEQPLLAGLILSHLFDGWMIVAQAASRLYEATTAATLQASNTRADGLIDMELYVPYLTSEALVNALGNAMDIPIAGAKAIVDFLTYRGEDRQHFWTQPLVSTGESSKLYPLFGVLVAPPNFRYVVECWMAQLDFKLEDRGPAFEEDLRAQLIEASAESPLLSEVSKVVPKDYTFNCPGGPVQIDALFCIGSHVFVVEAKCILEPTDSTSIGTHSAAIAHGVEQVKLRAHLIDGHRTEFVADMNQFGWDLPPAFSIHPLVAVSSVAHVGISYDGVPVVDEYVLTKFFSGGFDHVGLSTQDFTVAEGVRTHFYSSVEDAQSCAAAYFANPPQLKQYSAALTPRMFPIYAAIDGDWSGEVFDFE